MDNNIENLNSMVSLVKQSRVKSSGDNTFNWDKHDRVRLVNLIIDSNNLQCPVLLEFLTQCSMMTHDMLSSLLSLEKLNFDEIFKHISQSNMLDNAKFELFLKLVEDDSYEVADENVKQV